MAKARGMKVIIAGGGTGGHLFPGIAVAEALRAADPDCDVLFVGTDKPFEREAAARAGFEHRGIAVTAIKRRKWWEKLAALWRLVAAVFTAAGIIWRFKPDMILGVGGYASAPCLLAGFLMGKRTAVQEQNVAPGLTNKVLGMLSGRVYASFGESRDFFPEGKVLVTGNPVRLSLSSGTGRKRESGAPFTVMMVGGSQGAHGINTAVMEAIGKEGESLRGIRFIHQTGENDFQAVSEAYRAWGGAADVRPFFYDMAEQYEKTDLLVCRSGATTVAEITVLGKAAVFVPFPFAADNHQEKNARALEAAGAARVILQKDLTGSVFAGTVLELSRDPAALSRMEEASKAHGRPRAAADIAADMLASVPETGGK